MKKVISFALVLFLTTSCFSQSREDTTVKPISKKQVEKTIPTKHRIGLNMGGSNPFGDYSEIDQNSKRSGYANGGISLGLSYQYNFHESFALSFLYGSSANKFNAQAYVNQLSLMEPRLNWQVAADPYGVGFFMIGVKGYLGNEIKVYANPMFGYGAMISPQVEITASDGKSS